MIYLYLGTFTLLSLLTGLMADKMNSVRDEESSDGRLEDLKDLTESLRDIYVRKKKSSDGKLSKQEFSDLFKDRLLVDKLASQHIKIHGANEVYSSTTSTRTVTK